MQKQAEDGNSELLFLQVLIMEGILEGILTLDDFCLMNLISEMTELQQGLNREDVAEARGAQNAGALSVG